MAFPESLSWVFEGQEAEELLDKIMQPKQSRKLVTGSRHDMSEVHKIVVENARKRKAEQIARKRQK